MRHIYNLIAKYSVHLAIFGIVIIIMHNMLFFYSFTKQSAMLTEKKIKVQLSETAQQTANHIHTKTTALSDYIKASSEAFFGYDDLLSDASLATLTALNKYGGFNRVRIVLPNFISYDANGVGVDVSERIFLNDAFNGESGVSNVLSSVITDSNIIIYFSPIHRGETVVAVLTGTFEISSLSDAIDITSFGGHGFSSIVERDGDIVIIPSDMQHTSSHQSNEWGFLAGVEFEENFGLEQLKSSIQAGESGFFTYNVDGERRYTYYMPVGVNDWYVLQTVPESVIINQTGYINYISKQLLYKVIGLFIVAMIVIMIFGYTARRSIAETKRQLDSIVNAVPGGVAKCYGSGEYTFNYVSNGFLNMFNCTDNKLTCVYNNSLIGSIHPEDRTKIADLLSKQAVNTVAQLEYRINTEETDTIWVLNKCLRTVDSSDGRPYLYCVLIDITESKRIEHSLILSNERFRMAMSQTSNIVFEYDANHNRIHFVTKTSSYYNLPPTLENGPAFFVENGILSGEFSEHFLTCFKSIARPETTMVSMILKLRRADGKLVWNKLTLSSIQNPLCDSVRSIGTFEDITQTKEAQLRHKREEKYRAAMLSDAITTYEINLTSDRYIKVVSKENTFSLDYLADTYSNNLKKTAETLIYPEDRQLFNDIYNRKNLIDAFESGRLVLYHEYRHLDTNGQAFWISCTTNLLSDPENGDIKAFTYIKNIDTQKRRELAIKRNSERDSLTDLYNRKAAQNLIADYLSNSVSSSNKNAFISIDLDGFKDVNDRYGHMSGDDLLVKVAVSLRSVFRSNDLVARMGGDEFVVFMKNVEYKADVMAKTVEACNALKRLSVNDKISGISASMGIAMYPINGSSFEELYRKSDKALYHAKKAGKDRCVFYDDKME